MTVLHGCSAVAWSEQARDTDGSPQKQPSNPLQGAVASAWPCSVPGCEGATRINYPQGGMVVQDKYNIVRYEQPVFNTLFIIQKQNTLSTKPHMQGAIHPRKNTFISCKTQKCTLGKHGRELSEVSWVFPTGSQRTARLSPRFPVWCSPEMKTQAGVGVGTQVGERVCPLPCLLVPPLSRV